MDGEGERNGREREYGRVDKGKNAREAEQAMERGEGKGGKREDGRVDKGKDRREGEEAMERDEGKGRKRKRNREREEWQTMRKKSRW